MKTPDVIVIGGGVIGLAVADRLAADGRQVLLMDRTACGTEASWAGAGIVSPCSWHRRDELARIQRDAIFGYERFAADLHERSGIDPQYRRCGALKVIRDDQRANMARREVDAATGRTTPAGESVVQSLTLQEALRLEPELDQDLRGAQHCRMTAQVRSPRLLACLFNAAQRRGVCLLEHTPVRGLVKHSNTVTGVVTDQGTLSAGLTIVCAGAWSAQLDADLARAAPVYPVRGQIILAHAWPSPIRMIVEEGSLYIVPRDDGHILIGATEEHDAGFSKRNTAAGVARLAQQAVRLVPALEQAAVIRTWAGLRPGTPDRRPVLGEPPGIRGVLMCTGHFRSGLTTAPVVRDIVADLVDHGSCAYDLTLCRPGRFE